MQATQFTVGNIADTSALAAEGFVCTSHDAWWQDVGGPESGPKLIGWPAYDSWVRKNEDDTFTEIIVEEGVIANIDPHAENFSGEDQF